MFQDKEGGNDCEKKTQLISLIILLALGISPANADRNQTSQNLLINASVELVQESENTHQNKKNKKNKSSEGDFGYENPINGPDKWGELDPDFQLCSNGMEQSPIDIKPTKVIRENLPDVQYFYQPTSVHIVNNGHNTLQGTYDSGSFITIDGDEREYDLQQFHFHSVSEHTLAFGAHFNIEMHLVHTSIDGEVVVVTLLIRQGEENQALKEIWDNMPKNIGQEVFLPAESSFNAMDALPSDRRSYRYRGSFTTPPCTEGVRWIILREPIEMSAEQIEKYRNITQHVCCSNNNRPTQPLNGRQIYFDTVDNSAF
ncbi:carbonate dehydratase [Nitrosococcus oceani]|nr:carbonate dehydratase [Nitrosococcus oceani]